MQDERLPNFILSPLAKIRDTRAAHHHRQYKVFEKKIILLITAYKILIN